MLTYLPTIGGEVLVKSIRLAFFIVLKLKMVSDFLISLKCLAFLLCGATGFVKKKQILIHKENQTHVNKGLSDDITCLPTVGRSFRNVYMFGFLYCYKTENGV